MATNHTTNYNLNLWEASDKFVREEFNENTQKIDAAIKAEADARAAAVTAETNARTAAVNTLNSAIGSKAKVAAGYYVGNGASSRTISVGFTPKAVLIIFTEGYTAHNSFRHGGFAVTGSPAKSSGTTYIQIVSGGFQVTHTEYTVVNSPSETYNYVAIG